MNADLHLISGSTDSNKYLADGEINYLWYFIQGSIMDPFVRWELRKSWGFCQRHTIAWLIVEAAYHSSYLHGSSILLSDLIERAQKCFPKYKLPITVEMRLKNKKPCHMCGLGYTLDSKGSYAREETLVKGRDMNQILQFANETEMYWSKFICPLCAGMQYKDGILCRNHFLQALRNNNYSSINMEADFLRYLSGQIHYFSRSFRWECRGTETTECKAALITSAGWLNGWTEFIKFYRKWG
jgi:hypothetical protein